MHKVKTTETCAFPHAVRALNSAIANIDGFLNTWGYYPIMQDGSLITQDAGAAKAEIHRAIEILKQHKTDGSNHD